MVTKHNSRLAHVFEGLILAKNHMVTKQIMGSQLLVLCLILAKNHMVTKQYLRGDFMALSLILAKNHMVTKLFLKFIKVI